MDHVLHTLRFGGQTYSLASDHPAAQERGLPVIVRWSDNRALLPGELSIVLDYCNEELVNSAAAMRALWSAGYLFDIDANVKGARGSLVDRLECAAWSDAKATSLPSGPIAYSVLVAFNHAADMRRIRREFIGTYGRERGLVEHAARPGAFRRGMLARDIRKLRENMRSVGIRPGEARRAVLAGIHAI